MPSAHWVPTHWVGTAVAPAGILVPTLSIVDQADGTGATATVSGSTAGATNTIFAQAVGSTTVIDCGNRSGDGTHDCVIPSPLPRIGWYFFWVSSTNGTFTEVSNLVYLWVTDGDDAIHKQCLDAVVSVIESLSLAGIDNANIVSVKAPDAGLFGQEGALSLPVVFVSPIQEQTPWQEGLNSDDDILYGVLVTLVRAGGGQDETVEANLNAHLQSRESIRRAFLNEGLVAVPTVFTCRIEPSQLYKRIAWPANLELWELTIRCVSRENRSIP